MPAANGRALAIISPGFSLLSSDLKKSTDLTKAPLGHQGVTGGLLGRQVFNTQVGNIDFYGFDMPFFITF